MRVKVVLTLSVLMGAFNLFGGAAPAHACTAPAPSTACVWHDVCLVTGSKLMPYC
jgi:hypothetical protein